MLSLDDEKWKTLKGGYRVPFDPRPALAALASGNKKNAWKTLWENLHHQGDVGEASYAAVPHIVGIYREFGALDWNSYAIVATVELARTQNENPSIPTWLELEYFAAIQELARIGIKQFPDAKDIEEIQVILSVLAMAKGARVHAKFLLCYDAAELLEMESKL
ncbi:MAG TPA: hypothetical protein VJ731_05435 [Terriglobales bacterium]|nr:hypothetical protein [Terriglobales bacterium]